jgi:hypothetical protein
VGQSKLDQSPPTLRRALTSLLAELRLLHPHKCRQVGLYCVCFVLTSGALGLAIAVETGPLSQLRS